MNCTPADYRLQKSVGQTTDRKRARLPTLFSMKFTQVPSQYSKEIGEVQATIKVWVCANAPSRHISHKAVPPFGSSNNELHSCRLLIAEKHGANNQQEQSKAPLTVPYEIHTSPRQEYSNRFAKQTMSPNNSVVFHLIMVQRNGEKRSWITSGSHTSIGIDWHPFGVLEADDYHQNNRLRFGDKLIFVKYIYMYKKEFK
jgi:hypothetical protein